MEYLDFEEPIKDLIEKLNQTIKLGEEGDVDVASTVIELENKINNKRKEIYNNLSPWQKVQLSRHPQRPYTLDYINEITNGDFVELHGDRGVKDECNGWWMGNNDGETVMFIDNKKEEYKRQTV